MKSVLFVADFFHTDLSHGAGAESNDRNLIQALKKDFKVKSIYSHMLYPQDCKQADFIVVGNFVNLPARLKRKMIDGPTPYLIYEHDFKCFRGRDPSKFKDYVAPSEDVINLDFYQAAEKVICLSQLQKEIIEKNLRLGNCVSIGTSLWSQDFLKFISDVRRSTIKPVVNSYAVMGSQNAIKNTNLALTYCKKMDLNCSIVSEPVHRDFVRKLAEHTHLVFFPGVVESFSRLVAEAKMLDLKIVTNSLMLGAASEEELMKLSGQEFVNEVKKRCESAYDLFRGMINESERNG